jgi:hypothetical protein
VTERPFEIVIYDDGTAACVSDVDGVKIAWSACGACGKHISNCTEDFPTEPSYITNMRKRDA